MNVTYEQSDGGEWVDKLIDTGNEPNTPAIEHQHAPFRVLRVSVEDGSLVNDGTDIEPVTVEVVDGLEVARGTDPADATVLDHDGDVTLSIDGAETTKTLTSGSVSFDVTTEKTAGSTIEIVAESLADHPAESDSAEIEVVKA